MNKEDIKTLYENWIESWNHQSAEQMVRLLAENINMVGFDGSQMNGRSEVKSTLSDIFEHYPTGRFIYIIEEIREISPTTAILRAVVGMVPRAGNDINPAVNAIQTLVASQNQGEWKIEVFQNTPAAFHGRPELSEKLTRDLRELLQPP